MLHTLQYPKQKLFEPIENYYDKGRGDATKTGILVNKHCCLFVILYVIDL